MNIKKIKSHENMEKMPFSKKSVAFFLANSWHENLRKFAKGGFYGN